MTVATMATEGALSGDLPAPASRKEKRKALKKRRRRRARQEAAARAREAAEALSADPEEQRRRLLREQEEAEAAAREREAFEAAERRWLEAAATRAAAAAAEEEEVEASRKNFLEDSHEKSKDDHTDNLEEGEEWEYVEEGPAEIIWQGNEIIVKKKRVRVPKRGSDRLPIQEDDRPTSNPLPPQSVAFASFMKEPSISAQEALEKVAQETPNFGTEQDKAHCPFHLKTAACRFGVRCSRVHFYPDKSCTLLIKNMYNGPGLAWEQDEGLEYTDEEVECSYEEFYEDVHTEFLKFGELVNFKVCRNGSSHLRGNVYVHYRSLDSAVLAYNSMNGRYFAGKQIRCEFVSVTKWKAAICGEYMRSRLKTCSHGTACNFIHCFRNPGGDYEWADWDNPPPKYWSRKMAALFGPSVDSGYDKRSDLASSEGLRNSDRTRAPSNDRYDSRKSRDEKDVKRHHSLRDDSYSKHDRSSQSIKREHKRSRRESSSADKLKCYGEVDRYDGEYDVRKYSSSEEKERGFSHEHKRREEMHTSTSDHGYGRSYRAKEGLDERKGEKEKSKSRMQRSHQPEEERHEHVSSDRSSDFIDRDISKSPLSRKSGGRLTIDEERYNGRWSSEDPDHETGKEHRSKRRENSTRHVKDDDSPVYEIDGGRGKSRKHKPRSHEDHPDDSADRWEATQSDADSEDTRNQSSSSRSSKLERKHRKTSRKRKDRRERRKHTRAEKDASDSDGRDSNAEAHKSRSRSHEESRSSDRSRRKGSRSSYDS